jgi:hypothetical protein
VTIPVDSSKVVPADRLQGEDAEDTLKLRSLLEEARSYLGRLSWCGSIADEYFGLGVGGIVGVFLFKIIPTAPDVDDWLWVIVGDLPPAYIVTDEARNPAAALEAYVGEMQRWVSAAEKGDSVSDLIPVNVPPTPENSQRLRKRLTFLDREILCHHADDLRS